MPPLPQLLLRLFELLDKESFGTEAFLRKLLCVNLNLNEQKTGAAMPPRLVSFILVDDEDEADIAEKEEK